MASLDDLLARKEKLEKAAADPTKSVWYDDFKREMRPFHEIAAQLDLVEAQIRKARGTKAPDKRRLIVARTSGY